MIWSDIEGWFSRLDAKFVSDICIKIHSGIVVELGVFAGRSTAVMASICKQKDIEYYAIDNFSGSANKNDEATKHQQNRDIRKLFETNMKIMKLTDSMMVIQTDSIKAATLFEDDTVDFCFIDADHAPQAVQKDIEAWWSKIKKGGFIAGHDYQSHLRPVVDKFARDKGKRILTGGRCWAIQKENIKN